MCPSATPVTHVYRSIIYCSSLGNQFGVSRNRSITNSLLLVHAKVFVFDSSETGCQSVFVSWLSYHGYNVALLNVKKKHSGISQLHYSHPVYVLVFSNTVLSVSTPRYGESREAVERCHCSRPAQNTQALEEDAHSGRGNLQVVYLFFYFLERLTDSNPLNSHM